jgi:hypothetical protein
MNGHDDVIKFFMYFLLKKLMEKFNIIIYFKIYIFILKRILFKKILIFFHFNLPIKHFFFFAWLSFRWVGIFSYKI